MSNINNSKGRSFLTAFNLCLALTLGGCSSAQRIVGDLAPVRDSFYDVQDLKLSLKKNREDEIVKTKFEAKDFEPVLQKKSGFYENNPGYLTIAKDILDSGYSPAYQAVIASQLSNRASIQDRLPQISRQVSLSDTGGLIGRVDVDQVIIGNGRFAATKLTLNAQESAAVAEYEMEANEQIAQGLSVYLNLLHQQRRVNTIEKLIGIYGRYLQMAKSRVDGGVAGRTEYRLFELKKIQAEAELKQFNADLVRFKTEFEILTGKMIPDDIIETMSQDPWMQDNSVNRASYDRGLEDIPSYRSARAQVQQRTGELEQERASFKPSLSLRGSFGQDTDFAGLGGDFQTDFRLTVQYSQPLFWGKNLKVKALSAQLAGQQAELLQARREINIDLQVQDSLRESYFQQMEATKDVAELADQRALSFEKDFQAGAVGLAEAVSVIETAKTVSFEYLELLLLARQTDLETARILGLLGPLDAVRDLDDSALATLR